MLTTAQVSTINVLSLRRRNLPAICNVVVAQNEGHVSVSPKGFLSFPNRCLGGRLADGS